ncbi:MAG: hypothetical protein AAF694_01545 [Bacteroidota bacterium]
MEPRSIVISLFIIWALVGCERSSWEALDLVEASAWMIQDSSKQVIRWGLCQIYDPYQGGRVTKLDSFSQKVLEMRRDGRFILSESREVSKGDWQLNRARTELQFRFKSKNGVKVSRSDPSYEIVSQVRKITRDTMILAWQGRHGFVEELYSKNCLDERNNRVIPNDSSFLLKDPSN